MDKVIKTPPLKRFRKRVEEHIQEVEDFVDFLTDEEWKALVLTKFGELSNPINTDNLAKLGALVEVWGRRTVARTE